MNFGKAFAVVGCAAATVALTWIGVDKFSLFACIGAICMGFVTLMAVE